MTSSLAGRLKTIHNDDGKIQYFPHYTQATIEEAVSGVIWRNDQITMFGKTHSLPRLTAWHGEPGITHTYSKIIMISPGWTPFLLKLKNKLEKDLECEFNSVLINYYRDGNDHMSYHSDDEKELGKNPTIASISIGATRKFYLKHRFDKKKAVEIFELESQSLLVMKGTLQHYWLHKIAKSKKITQPRLNLTFRYIH